MLTEDLLPVEHAFLNLFVLVEANTVEELAETAIRSANALAASPEANEVKEQAALDMLRELQQVSIHVESLGCCLQTAYVGPSGRDATEGDVMSACRQCVSVQCHCISSQSLNEHS